MHQGSNVSRPSRQLKIQMRRVREVSIVDLWAAEAYLVVAIPKELKAAIEQIEIKNSQIIRWLSAI
jgi:hypothetical protein